MEEVLKQEFLEILDRVYRAIERDDVKDIRDAGNYIIDAGTVFQDENSVTLAVVVYSLGKIYERTDYRKYESWELFNKTTLSILKKAGQELKNDNLKGYEKVIKSLLDSVDKLDNKLKAYVKDVIYKAQVSRGSRFHEHGLSIGRTAKLLGINKWELMDYIGRTGIADVEEALTVSVRTRLNLVRSLFK